MSTPNIEELIEDLRLPFGLCPDEVVHAAADLLQSQAEHIKQLIDSVNFKHSKITELENERDTLRHELKVAQEGWRSLCSPCSGDGAGGSGRHAGKVTKCFL